MCSLVALVGLVSASSLEDASRALARGDARAAEQAARRAERWEPWADDPALTLGQALRAMGDTRAARAAFARAVAHDPDDYRAWLALATVSRGEAARVALLEAKALNPMAFPGL